MIYLINKTYSHVGYALQNTISAPSKQSVVRDTRMSGTYDTLAASQFVPL